MKPTIVRTMAINDSGAGSHRCEIIEPTLKLRTVVQVPQNQTDGESEKLQMSIIGDNPHEFSGEPALVVTLCLSLAAGSSGRNLANVRNTQGIYDAHVA